MHKDKCLDMRALQVLESGQVTTENGKEQCGFCKTTKRGMMVVLQANVLSYQVMGWLLLSVVERSAQTTDHGILT